MCANKEIDLVVSGINNGANLGADIFTLALLLQQGKLRSIEYPPLPFPRTDLAYGSSNYIRSCVAKSLEYVERALDAAWSFGEHWNINFPSENRR